MARGPNKNAPPSHSVSALALLTSVYGASQAGAASYVANIPDTVELVNAGFLTVNPAQLDPAGTGNALAQLTPAGAAYAGALAAQAPPAQAPAPAPAAAASAFVIEDAVPVPEKVKRAFGGRTREETYPFGKLELNQSFFVPESATMPDPVKTLSSTVTTANIRYSEEIPGEFETVTVVNYLKGADGKIVTGPDGKRMRDPGSPTKTEQRAKRKPLRYFIMQASTKDGVKGARVWRVDPATAG